MAESAVESDQSLPEWVDRLSWFHARIREALDADVAEVLQFAVNSVAHAMDADRATLLVFEPSIRDVRTTVVGGSTKGPVRAPFLRGLREWLQAGWRSLTIPPSRSIRN